MVAKGWASSSIILLFIIGISSPARAINLYSEAKPQAQDNTCQSYFAILALAAEDHPAYRIDTFEELRTAERDFRAILENLPGSYKKHRNWRKAMEKYTGGLFTIQLDYVNGDLIEWLKKARELTNINDNIGAAIEALDGKKFSTVLTSVIRLDGNIYKDGHIISILGVLGNGIDSSTRIVSFNSAIKRQKGTGNFSSAPGDETYKAGIVESSDFQLKNYSGKFLLMRIVLNE